MADLLRTLAGPHSIKRNYTIGSISASFPVITQHSGPSINRIRKYMFDRFPIDPYIDDIKEAASLDFLPEYDEKKIEFSDGEYRLSLLYSKPLAFITDLQGVDVSLEPFNLKQMKFITSTILASINKFALAFPQNRFIYHDFRSNYSTFLAPHFLLEKITNLSTVAYKLFMLLKQLIIQYPDDT
jgi:hypothetical protein